MCKMCDILYSVSSVHLYIYMPFLFYLKNQSFKSISVSILSHFVLVINCLFKSNVLSVITYHFSDSNISYKNQVLIS